MRKGEATRESIVGEALSQAVHVGLEGLSLGVLASSLELSKSGLFAHFKSKEALQLAVLEEAISRFRTRVITPSLDAPDAVARLEALFKNYLRWIKGQADMGGCPFMMIAQEFADKPGVIRNRFVESQSGWRAFLAGTVAMGAREGVFASDIDSAQFAFEFMGMALAYHLALKIGDGRSAMKRANDAFAALMQRAVKKS